MTKPNELRASAQGLLDELDAADKEHRFSRIEESDIRLVAEALPDLLSTIERLQARVTELEIKLGINEQRNAEISELAGEPVNALKMVKPKRRKFRNARKAIEGGGE